MWRGFLVGMSCWVVCSAWGASPNIVFILVDDLGYADLGCYGNSVIQTPALDGLAKEGVRFTNFYAAAGVCTPTRAALLTGCYPKRVGMHKAVLPPRSQNGLHPDEVTIAELLKGKGYATACVGKWHLGESPQTLPTGQGFDSYFGMAGPNHGASDLYRDGKVIEEKGKIDLSQLTQRYAKEAVAFIRANKEKPFFLYLAHGAVHIPHYASEGFKGKSAAGLYGDMVQELDWSVGEVLRVLKELGLEKNTIIVFTSDNGQHGVAAPPLHGGKGSTWEAGQRVPCIVRWPGQAPAGTVSGEMAVIFDFYPTFAGIAGAKLPQDRPIDGKDILALIQSPQTAKSPHESFVYYSRESFASAIRMGKWKLHVVAPVERWAGKLPVKETLLDTKPKEALPWLYDLESDVGETRNVAGEHPQVVEKLKKALEETDRVLTEGMRAQFVGEKKE